MGDGGVGERLLLDRVTVEASQGGQPPGNGRATLRSAHARLLATALASATQAPRPPAEVAVRVLLARAQVPTAAAVAGQLVAIDHHRAAVTAREQRRQARRAPESSEAARAATLVAEHWQAHGHGPTWRALGRAMGWPPLEVDRASVGWQDPAVPVRRGGCGRVDQPTAVGLPEWDEGPRRPLWVIFSLRLDPWQY